MLGPTLNTDVKPFINILLYEIIQYINIIRSFNFTKHMQSQSIIIERIIISTDSQFTFLLSFSFCFCYSLSILSLENRKNMLEQFFRCLYMGFVQFLRNTSIIRKYLVCKMFSISLETFNIALNPIQQIKGFVMFKQDQKLTQSAPNPLNGK